MSVEETDFVYEEVDAYEIYERMSDAWFDILQSDISVFAYFDAIHPADVFFSWLNAFEGDGIINNEFIQRPDVEDIGYCLAWHMYNAITEIMSKKILHNTFQPKNNKLTVKSLYRSLLYERQKL